MDQGVAHEVDAAPLPGGAEDPADSRLDALMGVGDHQLDAPKASACQLAQELSPESRSLRGTDVHAQNLAAAIGIDANGDNHSHRDNASVLTDLQVGRIDPDIRLVALDWTL